MEQEFLIKFKEGVGMFLELVNWAFVAFFMIWTIVLNMTVKKSVAKQTSKFALWVKRVPKAYWIILQGIILAGVWGYLFRYTTREDIAGLLFGITASMVIYKMGIQKVITKTEK